MPLTSSRSSQAGNLASNGGPKRNAAGQKPRGHVTGHHAEVRVSNFERSPTRVRLASRVALGRLFSPQKDQAPDCSTSSIGLGVS